jgi:excisionase family DNA binding protein
MNSLPNKQYLTPKEVAAYYQINIRTLYSWIAEGKVEAERIGPYRILRIRRETVERMALSIIL